jgi:hypothetical protein
MVTPRRTHISDEDEHERFTLPTPQRDHISNMPARENQGASPA